MPDARINIPAEVPRGKPFEVRLLIRHPMETGYRHDNTGKQIPRNVVATLACCAGGATAQERVLPLSELRSGVTFAGSNVRAMQADDLANAGMLWVERGEKLWNAAAESSGKSCTSC